MVQTRVIQPFASLSYCMPRMPLNTPGMSARVWQRTLGHWPYLELDRTPFRRHLLILGVMRLRLLALDCL